MVTKRVNTTKMEGDRPPPWVGDLPEISPERLGELRERMSKAERVFTTGIIQENRTNRQNPDTALLSRLTHKRAGLRMAMDWFNEMAHESELPE